MNAVTVRAFAQGAVGSGWGATTTMDRRDGDYVEFVRARSAALRRTAYLLCGDWQRAQDLVQTALVKLYVAWPRLPCDCNVDGYVRTILARSAIDEFRRAHRHRETPTEQLPETPAPAGDADNALDIRQILQRLPPRQRAVIVLRYWEDLTITDTAQLLHITEGTVKSQTAKALTTLRGLLGPGTPALKDQP